MRFSLLVLLISGFFAQPTAAHIVPASKDTIATRVQLPGADCALFPAAAKMEHAAGEKLPITGRFTPTLEQVASAEQLLPSVSLATVYAPGAGPSGSYYAHYPLSIKWNLSRYQRQYYGFYNSAHQPCLFINFFIQHYEEVPGRPATWLRRRIFFFDGGTALWCIYYNTTTHEFYNFSHGVDG
jgi:hypothetical protein